MSSIGPALRSGTHLVEKLRERKGLGEALQHVRLSQS